MGKFKSINYSRVVCGDCGEVTVIEPGTEFAGLACRCEVQETLVLNDTEVSTPVQQELDYVKTQTVTVIGRFEDGDYEVCNSNNLDDTWRVPKDTFEGTFEVVTNDEVQDDEDTTTNAQVDDVSEESDPSNTVTLSLSDLVGKTTKEVKETYNMDELRVLAKASKIRGATQMNEDKLVGKLLAKAE